jgi:hypothetical protein
VTQQHRRAARAVCLVLFALIVSPRALVAQEPNQSSFVTDVVKRVVLDPTTYAPAIISYDAIRRDWESSQPFFAAGYVERNSRYTITGYPNDVALSYDAGNRRILMDAMANLQVSLINNISFAVFERALVDRHPEHRKLIRTLGWIERISVASFVSYRFSAEHYRQAAMNDQAARQYGLK